MLQDLIDRLESGEPEQPLSVRRMTGVKVSVSDIREALAKNPDHPQAWVFANAIEDLDGDDKVIVNKPDILGLAKNQEVHIRHVRVDGELHIVKELGASLDRPAPRASSGNAAPAADPPAALPPAPGPSAANEDAKAKKAKPKTEDKA